MRYFEAARLPAIFRVPSKAYDQVARAADMGAEGVMVPMVDTAEEARDLASYLKYTPAGRRGVALGIAHDNYGGSGSVHERLSAANRRTCLFAQIETASGVEEAEAIAAVDGVDCLWVGHFDLSASLGIPGEFEHAAFLDAIDRVAAACRRHGKALGRLVPDAATGVDYAARGFDFLCWSGDVWALQAAVRGGIDAMREGIAASASGAEGLTDGRLPRRPERRFSQGGRLAGLSDVRPVAAAARARSRAGLCRARRRRHAGGATWRASTP